MKKELLVFYNKELGIDGTIPELVDFANKYTDDYSDEALLHISNLAKENGFEEKYIQIPRLLVDERRRGKISEDGVGTPYERMKIDYYLFNKISYTESNFGQQGTELEISSSDEEVLVSIYGSDERGFFTAANSFHIDEFMQGDFNWLDKVINETLFYGKEYE